MFFITFAALGQPIRVDAIFIVFTLTGVLQTAGVAFFGFPELVMTLTLTALNISPDVAVSVALLTRVVNLWFRLIVSYAALQWAGIKIMRQNKTKQQVILAHLGLEHLSKLVCFEGLAWLLIGNILMNSIPNIIQRIDMPTAFVLINTEIGSESDVLKELKKVEGVEEASAVYGVYDIVARVKAETMDKLKEIVTWRIRRLDKVRSTLTMIVVEDKQ